MIEGSVLVNFVGTVLTVILGLLVRPNLHNFLKGCGTHIQLELVILHGCVGRVFEEHLVHNKSPRVIPPAYRNNLVAPNSPTPAQLIITVEIFIPRCLVAKEVKLTNKLGYIVITEHIKNVHQRVEKLVGNALIVVPVVEMVLIKHVFPTVFFGIGERASIPNALDGNDVMLINLANSVIEAIHNLPLQLSRTNLIAVGGLVYKVVCQDGGGKVGTLIDVVGCNVLPKLAHRCDVGLVRPKIDVTGSAVFKAGLTACNAVHIDNNLQIVLLCKLQEVIQLFKCVITHGESIVRTFHKVAIVHGQTNGVQACVADQLEIRLGAIRIEERVEQFFQLFFGKVTLGNAFCQECIEFFLKDFFVFFHNALLVYTFKATVLVVERTNRVDGHPSLGNKQVAKVDALDVEAIAVGIVQTAANRHNGTILVASQFNVCGDVVGIFACGIQVACQSQANHQKQHCRQENAHTEQYFFPYVFHNNLTFFRFCNKKLICTPLYHIFGHSSTKKAEKNTHRTQKK